MLNSTTRILRNIALTGAAITAIAAQPALAADSAELTVSATVPSVCNVTTTAVAFGNVDVTTAGNVDATGGFSVVCTNGTAWTAAASAGVGVGASTAARKMTSGSDLLNYALYTDAGRSVNFVSATGTGSGAAQPRTIYGRIPSGQSSAPAGSYADSVTVSLTY
jgi:spore coat protein U-like protein